MTSKLTLAVWGERARSAPLATGPKLALALGLLALLGLAVSIELTRIHLLVHTDPDYHSVCAVSDGLNCETVALSSYSVFAGLPVSVWGIIGYAGLAALSLWGASRFRLHATWPLGLLLPLVGIAVVTSAALGYLSITRIDSLCLFCLCSYAINAVLLALGLLAWRRSRTRMRELLLADYRALTARPALIATLAAVGVATVVGPLALVPAYWHTAEASELPSLASGIDEDGHHWLGAREPVVTIVEFSDYQCPHCRAAHRRVRALVADRADRIRLVHRHLPLDHACHPAIRRPFHRQACLLSRAAECAGQQDRFWAMNDALVSIQDRIRADRIDLVELADRLGLDPSRFRRCLDSQWAADRVAADVRAAMLLGIEATPTFQLHDQLYVGGIPGDALERALAETP